MAKYIDLETLEPLDDGDIFVQNTMTNADLIRQMTDEKLASFLYHSWNNASWCNGGCDGECSCEPCWLNWLKQEVDDEHTD